MNMKHAALAIGLALAAVGAPALAPLTAPRA